MQHITDYIKEQTGEWADLFRRIKSYWGEPEASFFEEKTKEMKQILPTIECYKALKKNYVVNAEGTKDRKPCCNIGAWHKYWMIVSGHFENKMECGFCKKPIFADIHTQECFESTIGKFDKDGNPDKIENHQAHGGHLEIDILGEGYFITPLCPCCNSKEGETFELLKDVIVVKEEKADTKKQ
jgi:hypothetical protein